MSCRPDRSGRTRGPATPRRRGRRPSERGPKGPAAPGLPGALPSGHLLYLELREFEGVVPALREDAAVFVVPREPADLRLDQLQAPLVAEVLAVLFQVRLEVRGPLDEPREV